MAASSSSNRLFLFFFFFFMTMTTWSMVCCNHTYLVFMNPSHKPSVHPSHADWFHSHLQSLGIDPSLHLLYTYPSSLPSLFSAHLLPHHLPPLRSSPSLLLLLPDPLLSLHTTRSPHFLHLPPLPPPPPTSSTSSSSSSSSAPSSSSDVIIGVLDTGVWPELPSFSDAGLPAVPSKWKGECEAGVDFSPSLCNRKLIGARSFRRAFAANADAAAGAGGPSPPPSKQQEFSSPRDRDGHGTHTTSTAAGSASPNASLLGYAPGLARGMAPLARLAAYKVCWSSGCYGSDILAGIDRAVADGVDVLSLSLGGGSSPNFLRDPIAVGTFAAVQRGVFVACSAGNSGPGPATLTNTAPWIATVGAGTLDRDFPAYASLGNGHKFGGVSLYSGKGMGSRMAPLVYGGGGGSGGGGNSSKLCLTGTLDPKLVKGKVVLCDRGINARVEKGLVVKEAGGIGMILANNAASGEELVADSHLLPAVAVGKKEGDRIREYVLSNADARAVLSFAGTTLNVKPSPVVAAFSSRGPNTATAEILKPDLIGPGVNILAGWSGAVGPTGLAKDDRRSEFNILSGTSMSCPHISGVAALLKAAHPNWSPAAIKSALMTTAYIVDNTGSQLLDAADAAVANPLAYGSGYVDPQKALSPGLVYDATAADYIAFLCSVGNTAEQVQAVSKNLSASCARKLSNPGNLNYPSFSVVFSRRRLQVKYGRELTNVGPRGSVYTVKYGGPDGVRATVKPTRLVFREAGDKLRYSISFAAKKGGVPAGGMAFGWVEWSNAEHRVRSPVSYTWKS